MAVERSTGRFFCALSAARGRRIVHPSGVAFHADVDVGDGVEGTAALAPAARFGCLVRFSLPLGAWRAVATVATRAPLSQEEAEALRFDARRCSGGLVPWS